MRYREGGNYPVFTRAKRGASGQETETILFDGDTQSTGFDFFDIGAVAHSPDHKYIAYALDTLGSEYFTIRVRNIDNGKDTSDEVTSTDGNPVWNATSDAFYYVERDDHQRPKRVKRHQLGTDPSSDPVLYEEADDGFFLGIGKSQSGTYIFIETGNSVSSEVWVLSSNAPATQKPTLIAPRKQDEIYSLDHHGEYFYIRTNAGGAIDFKICRAPISSPDRDAWQDWLTHEPGAYLLSFTPYKDRIVRMVRRNALPEIVIATYDRQEELVIGFEEDAFSLGMSDGFEFDTDILRFTYSSPTTPQQTYDYHMKSGVRTLLKTQEVPSGHDPSHYVVERHYAVADDGAKIPITLLRLKQTPADGTAPLLLYGYGSYGITIPSDFSTAVLSIVDRGAVYATAHIRGGAAKGRQWYLDGKLTRKMNTFTDFINAAEMLQSMGYGHKHPNTEGSRKKGGTVIYGGSAGGLLVGASVNLRPDLFTGVIGAVPFVDVINTISDASLPLTPPEWDEWGNPIEDAHAYQTILSYSPYDNIHKDTDYPAILATGGLADYRVTYWEPAKWIARLRAQAKGGPFFLKMNMEAGHGGSAARFERLKERAHDYAFALKIFGLI